MPFTLPTSIDCERRVDEHLVPGLPLPASALKNDEGLGKELARWGTEAGAPWLFAWGLDGVIWGRVEGGALTTSGQAARGPSAHLELSELVGLPELRVGTLLELHLFGPRAALRLWRSGTSFDGAVIGTRDVADVVNEGESDSFECARDASLVLVGDHARPLACGFTLFGETPQLRHRHAVPTPDGTPLRPPYLVQRRFLGPDGRTLATRYLDLDPATP